LSGESLISLPFSDHCDPLVETEQDFEFLVDALKRKLEAGNAKYLEMRPIAWPEGPSPGLKNSDTFCFHQLDLSPSLDAIFSGFHKDCVQRKIRRAEREGLTYDEGTSDSHLARFYDLLVASRRRQQLPPQPRAWFRHLIAALGDQLKIRIASKAGRPVASILTLRFKDTLVYKYGCSDKESNNLGGMPLLFWRSIQEARAAGMARFDLGRSDWENAGLIAFKDRWGATRSTLEYRISSKTPVRAAGSDWQVQMAKRIFGHMPNAFLPLAGSLVYRHLQRPRAG
jgi:hypothetical protein